MTDFIHCEVAAKPYHYTDCGLDDVWLDGGVEYHETPYGPATSIHNIDELHAAIGMSIIRSESMTGKEFRYLRVELDLSQKALAVLLRSSEQQIHRWETGKSDIPGSAEVALAGYYVESLNPDSRLKELMDQLSELDSSLSALEARHFTPEDDNWVISAAA